MTNVKVAPTTPMPRAHWWSASGDAAGYDSPGHAWKEGTAYAFAVYAEGDQKDEHWSGYVMLDAADTYTGWSVMSPGPNGDPANRYMQKVHGHIGTTADGGKYLVLNWLSQGSNRRLRDFREHTEYVRIPIL